LPVRKVLTGQDDVSNYLQTGIIYFPTEAEARVSKIKKALSKSERLRGSGGN
jgi:hypothetical protein